jgi:hypothetical protein
MWGNIDAIVLLSSTIYILTHLIWSNLCLICSETRIFVHFCDARMQRWNFADSPRVAISPEGIDAILGDRENVTQTQLAPPLVFSGTTNGQFGSGPYDMSLVCKKVQVISQLCDVRVHWNQFGKSRRNRPSMARMCFLCHVSKIAETLVQSDR